MGGFERSLSTAYQNSAGLIRSTWSDQGHQNSAGGTVSASDGGFGESGLERRTDGYSILYFGKTCFLAMPAAEFKPDGLSKSEQVLVLHYIAGALGLRDGETAGPVASDSTGWISFSRLPGAAFYEPTFKKRGPDLLLRFFSRQPELLVGAGEGLNGRREGYGDYSVAVPAFPDADVLCIINEGDDEFPPEGDILFSASAVNYLSIEDAAVLATTTALTLAKEGGVR
jgi:hypothetical protein